MTKVQKTRRHCFACLVTLTFDLLIPKYMGFHDSWWNISTASLVILAGAVIEIARTDTQTDNCH